MIQKTQEIFRTCKNSKMDIIFPGEYSNTIIKPTFYIAAYYMLKMLNKYKIFKECQIQGVHLTVTFLTREDMASLNLKHRNINKETDVLSFPIYENIRSGEEELVAQTPIELGDVFVCYPYIKDLTADNDYPEAQMFKTIIHGIVHLLGYDHELGRKEERIMTSIERRIFTTVKIGMNTWKLKE